MENTKRLEIDQLIDDLKKLKFVEIFGFDFKIKWSDSIAFNDGFHGHINYNPHEITLSTSQADRELCHTVIHEVLYGIDQYGKIKDNGTPLSDNEIDRITNGLLSVVFHSEVNDG